MASNRIKDISQWPDERLSYAFANHIRYQTKPLKGWDMTWSMDCLREIKDEIIRRKVVLAGEEFCDIAALIWRERD